MAEENDNQAALYAALSRAQGKVENAKKLNKNPHFKSNYADLATVWDTIREPFTSEGLSVLQYPISNASYPGHIGLNTALLHKDGGNIADSFFLQLKDPSNPQVLGSCLTYMKRYALMGLAGIGSEDDDGNAGANAGAGKSSVAVAPKAVAIDYRDTIKETMEQLKGSSPEEARMLYSTVRNSVMQEGPKNDLLKQMFVYIQSMQKETK